MSEVSSKYAGSAPASGRISTIGMIELADGSTLVKLRTVEDDRLQQFDDQRNEWLNRRFKGRAIA